MPKPSPSTVAAYTAGAIIAYLLSVGPVGRLADRGIISPETFDKIYASLDPLLNIPGFGKAISWYAMLWEPHYYSDQAAPTAPAKPTPPPDAKKPATP